MGLGGDEVTGHWRKLNNEELFDLYFSSDTINAIKLRRMRWAGRVPHVEEGRDAYRILVQKP